MLPVVCVNLRAKVVLVLKQTVLLVTVQAKYQICLLINVLIFVLKDI